MTEDGFYITGDVLRRDANGFITGRVFSVTAKRGAMEFAQGRRMQAADIYFKIPDTRPAPIVRWPTSELPICPSGRPTARPQAVSCVCG